jgi:hypothetical protein
MSTKIVSAGCVFGQTINARKVMKTYNTYWDNFNVELYRKIVESRKAQQDLVEHKRVFVI